MPMRIALLTSQWPGVRLGGIGAYTFYCARGLAGAGLDVHIFTLNLPQDAAVPEGVRVHQVAGLAELGIAGKMPAAWADAIRDGGEPLYRLLTGTLLCEALRSAHAATPFDIIEAPEYEALGLPLIRQPLENVPLVTQLHSGTAVARLFSQTLVAGNLYERLELAQILESSALCTPSQAVCRDTANAYSDPDVYSPSPALPQPTIIGLPFDAPDIPFTPPPPGGPILYIGRLESLKGADTFAEGTARFLKNHPLARARIIGPDSMNNYGKTSMQAQMVEIFKRAGDGVLRQVTFTGERTRAQIDAELEGCSLVVVPSRCESYSYVCCEALAAGRPVIVSADIGAAEVVGNAGVAFPFEPFAQALTNAITTLWNNPAEITRLARMAYDRARNELSTTTSITRRIAFYKECIARRQTNPSRLDENTRRAVKECFQAISGEVPFPATQGPPSPGMRLTNILKRYGTAVEFHLYGAGRHTLRLMAERTLWETLGHRAIGIIDDHPRFSGSHAGSSLDLPVRSLAVAEAQLVAGEVVILSTDAFEEQFWRKTEGLRGKGVVVYRLYG